MSQQNSGKKEYQQQLQDKHNILDQQQSIHSSAMSTGLGNYHININSQKQSYKPSPSKQLNYMQNLESVQEYSIESDNNFNINGQQRFQTSLSQQSQQGGSNNSQFYKLYNEEKNQNMVLQEKLQQKEKLIQQMKSFHNEICQAYDDSQEQLTKLQKDRGVLQEKDGEIKIVSQKCDEIEKLNLQMEEENKNLTAQNLENQQIQQQLQVQQDILQKDNSVLNQKFQFQLEKYHQLEQDYIKLQSISKNQNSQLQDYKFKVDQLTEDNAKMSIKIENNENDTRILLQEREELLHRITQYEFSLQEIENKQEIRMEERAQEQNKIHQEKQNLAMIDWQYKYHQKEKKLKEQIMNQKQQIKYLDQELKYFQSQSQGNSSKKQQQIKQQSQSQIQPQVSNYQTLQQQQQMQQQMPFQKTTYQSDVQQQYQDKLKQSELRIQNLEQAFKQMVSPSKQDQESLDSDNLVHKLLEEFSPQDLSDLYNRIKEQKKLSECLQNMVMNFNSSKNPQQQQQQQEVPTLKQSWKWLKRVLEDYMVVKKQLMKSQQQQKQYKEQLQQLQQQQQAQLQQQQQQQQQQYNPDNIENNNIIQKIQEFLKCDNKKDIIPQVADILIENEVSYRVFQKVKKVFDCEWVQSISELEKLLTENQLQQRNQLLQNQEHNIQSPKFNNDTENNNNIGLLYKQQQQQQQDNLKNSTAHFQVQDQQQSDSENSNNGQEDEDDVDVDDENEEGDEEDI